MKSVILTAAVNPFANLGGLDRGRLGYGGRGGRVVGERGREVGKDRGGKLLLLDRNFTENSP